jgi:hypothetical protein
VLNRIKIRSIKGVVRMDVVAAGHSDDGKSLLLRCADAVTTSRQPVLCYGRLRVGIPRRISRNPHLVFI